MHTHHKGHGKTVKREEDYGHFEPNVGWSKAVSDVIFVSETIRKEQTCPLFYLDIVWVLFIKTCCTTER